MDNFKVFLKKVTLPNKALVVFVISVLVVLSIEDYLVSFSVLSHRQTVLFVLAGTALAFFVASWIYRRSVSSDKGTGLKNPLKSILDSSDEMVWAIDTNYRLLMFNEAFRSSIRLFSGHECQIGDNVLSIEIGPDNEKWRARYDKALRGMTFDFEDNVPDEVGGMCYQNSFQPLRNETTGKIVGVSCFSKDITWKVEQERKLRESGEKLQMVLDGANLGIWDLNMVTREAQYNDTFNMMLGYGPGELGGAQDVWEGLLYPGDVKLAWSSVGRHARGESDMIDMEYRMRHKDGHWVWIHNRGKIMERDSEGAPLRILGTHLDITERKKAEKELQRLSLVASKNHNGVIITDSNVKVAWVNSAYEEMTGFTLPEIIGKYPGDYVSGPDTDQEVSKRIRERLGDNKIIREEVVYYRKDGRKIWVALEITPIFDADGKLERFISIETDITEKKEQDKQRIILEAAVKNIAEAVLIISSSCSTNSSRYRVVYANDAFFKMTGYSANEVEDRNPIKLLRGPASEAEKLSNVFEAIASENYIQEELISYRKNGESFWINLAVSPVGDLNQNDSHFFVAIIKDVTDKKQAQSETQNLTHELISRNKELQEFTQIVSHNLRAPVVNILGLTQIFDKSQAFNEFNLKIVGHLTESAQQLDTILIDLNDILQMKEPSTQAKQKFVLRDLVQQVLSSFILQVEESGAQITLHVDGAIRMEAVKSYIHSIVHNLTTNAIKYRNPRRKPQLDVVAYRTKTDLVLWVKDNGLGMDTNQVEGKLFKLYKRFHNHVDGKGMGLFLVKTQVERMGGTIKVYSTLGKGTAFRIVIPKENCLAKEEEFTEVVEVV